MASLGNPTMRKDSNLADNLVVVPELRAELMAKITELAKNEFQNRRENFRALLGDFDRQVFDACQAIPYASKDWWRNPHDIYVTQSLHVIVESEQLPSWLVTAAILHDRGYGILANQSGEEATLYLQKGGAHWENPDTRILHSLLSRRFAEEIIFQPEGQFYALRHQITNPELFLKVIETHDHPLIGKFEELPKVGRHHFDADSLFSISLFSFVKDYLSYLGDAQKLQKAKEKLDIQGDRFEAKDLLLSRLARYYPEVETLPIGWDRQKYPLISKYASFSEAGICLPPSSMAARSLTDQSFRDIAECCDVLGRSENLSVFVEWLGGRATAQFSRLQRQIEQ